MLYYETNFGLPGGLLSDGKLDPKEFFLVAIGHQRLYQCHIRYLTGRCGTLVA